MQTSALQDTVDRHVTEDRMHFLHPFDDLHLIAGYARYLVRAYYTFGLLENSKFD